MSKFVKLTFYNISIQNLQCFKHSNRRRTVLVTAKRVLRIVLIKKIQNVFFTLREVNSCAFVQQWYRHVISTNLGQSAHWAAIRPYGISTQYFFNTYGGVSFSIRPVYRDCAVHVFERPLLKVTLDLGRNCVLFVVSFRVMSVKIIGIISVSYKFIYIFSFHEI